MNWILKRLLEPSSWAGISVLLTVVGVPVPYLEGLGSIFAGAAALCAIALPESKTP
jgi:hypothetical protein